MNNKEVIYDGIFFLMGVLLTIITRSYSNAVLRDKYLDTNQGDPTNLLPWSNSIYLVFGFISILFSTIWAFFINVWVAIAFLIIYLFTNLIPSRLNNLRKFYRLANHKKCISCKKFYDYSYYGIREQNPLILNDTCVACSSPEIWNKVQAIKSTFSNS